MTPEEIMQLTTEVAVDASWVAIRSEAVWPEGEDVEWLDVGEEGLERVADEVKLLVALRLAEIHPEHPTWIREIAEL